MLCAQCGKALFACSYLYFVGRGRYKLSASCRNGKNRLKANRCVVAVMGVVNALLFRKCCFLLTLADH